MTSTSERKKTVKGGQEPEVRSPLRQQQRLTGKRTSAEVKLRGTCTCTSQLPKIDSLTGKNSDAQSSCGCDRINSRLEQVKVPHGGTGRSYNM